MDFWFLEFDLAIITQEYALIWSTHCSSSCMFRIVVKRWKYLRFSNLVQHFPSSNFFFFLLWPASLALTKTVQSIMPPSPCFMLGSHFHCGVIPWHIAACMYTPKLPLLHVCCAPYMSFGNLQAGWMAVLKHVSRDVNRLCYLFWISSYSPWLAFGCFFNQYSNIIL